MSDVSDTAADTRGPWPRLLIRLFPESPPRKGLGSLRSEIRGIEVCNRVVFCYLFREDTI